MEEEEDAKAKEEEEEDEVSLSLPTSFSTLFSKTFINDKRSFPIFFIIVNS